MQECITVLPRSMCAVEIWCFLYLCFTCWPSNNMCTLCIPFSLSFTSDSVSFVWLATVWGIFGNRFTEEHAWAQEEQSVQKTVHVNVGKLFVYGIFIGPAWIKWYAYMRSYLHNQCIVNALLYQYNKSVSWILSNLHVTVVQHCHFDPLIFGVW